MEQNEAPNTNYKQVVVDVPEDRVPEFHAFFARFLAGSRRGPGRRRRHGYGRSHRGRHGHGCAERAPEGERPEGERAETTGGSTEISEV